MWSAARYSSLVRAGHFNILKAPFMWIKNNYFLPNAAAAAGVVVSADNAIVDALLSITLTTGIKAAEISDDSGRVIVFATVKINNVETTRAVADTSGNLKLFATSQAAIKFARGASLAPGAVISYVPYQKPASVGDPLASLEARYKAACGKGFAALKKHEAGLEKLQTAVAFGWDTSTGATFAEYTDIQSRVAALDEWKTTTFALIDTLGERLKNVGVIPDTVADRPELPE